MKKFITRKKISDIIWLILASPLILIVWIIEDAAKKIKY